MAETSTVQVNGIILSYREWTGEGKTVICLPSFAAHKGSFERLGAALSPDYRVIAIDLRGRGDSDKPEEGYGFAYHVSDILMLTKQLGIDKFSIVGHSFGATVGTYLASIRPSLVEAIVLLEGGADPTERVLKAIRPTLNHLESPYPSMAAYLKAMRAMPFYGRQWGEMLEAYLREDVYLIEDGCVQPKASAQSLHKDLDLHFLYSMCLHFPALSCPALFVRADEGLTDADHGHIFTDAETDAIVKWIPKGRRLDVSRVNHFTMLLNDDAPIIQPVRAFLDEVYSA
ncbi:alpha/beta fold hydrolase [Sedimenticola selenatireducens]|jgi:pimeloyl-ACP methyl ester carboxylesterase|uniref:Alpha/beta hydrolase n=1 Tax=Sedimenticola selenatireducens TaxID=191960 RepID=A0A557SLN5_9GAMM|nr:alpha/beta hydrolase [Sedimenticola selenatireducens]TVO78335.1 alpha/beta hydrolase [Sedimenticola selenatireducens]TVT62807.1 MAG: alpha/beta hydrolase [Sedimenticola selenatireducens]